MHAIATSAIRDAANRDEFLARAGERTGLKVEILSEQDEARFGYVAAINTSTLTDGAVLELGGGSMQLIEVADRRARDSLRTTGRRRTRRRSKLTWPVRGSARNRAGRAGTPRR